MQTETAGIPEENKEQPECTHAALDGNAPPRRQLQPVPSADVASSLGVDHLPLVAVGSHDTASAVVGTPLADDTSAYLSLGTWGLVGLELDSAVLTGAARAGNFTNEGGVDGTVRFLTNVMGTWLLSEAMRTWDRTDLAALLAAAADVTGEVPVFDVQDPRFVPPGDMPARIVGVVRRARRPATG